VALQAAAVKLARAVMTALDQLAAMAATAAIIRVAVAFIPEWMADMAAMGRLVLAAAVVVVVPPLVAKAAQAVMRAVLGRVAQD
jgi:hypothetical protein